MHLWIKPHTIGILFLFLYGTAFLSAEADSQAAKQFELMDIEQNRMTDVKQQAEILEVNMELKSLKEERQRLLDQQEMIQKEKLKQEAEATCKRDNRITVHINLSQQRMKVFKGDDLIGKWRVSTAKRGYVTPVGSYQPQFVTKMHYSKRYHRSPMPYSIFFHGNFAIHGTNAIRQLGRKASHGCVRLHPKNAKKLYALIGKYGKDNTFIEIVY